MIITITSIKLKSLWQFSPLSLHALKIMQQMKQEQGFIQFKKTGLGYVHYTLSAWENEEAMKRFTHAGAHLEAMKKSKQIASEIRTYTYKSEQIPDWKSAKKLLQSQGKVLQFE